MQLKNQYSIRKILRRSKTNIPIMFFMQKHLFYMHEIILKSEIRSFVLKTLILGMWVFQM